LAPSPSRSETAAEAAEKRDASRDEKKRFLLRQIKLAESLRGKKIMRLRELFDEAVLDALEEASFGEKTGRNWQESTTAIFIRSRLLELGVRYAYDVIGDDQLGDMLTAIVDATQKHQKRRATLSAADREASRQLDVPDNTKALTAACRKSAADFKANPSPRRHVAAQCGIGVLLQLGTGRPPFIVRTAKFAGPPRTMPDGEIRPTLVLNDPTLKNMEKDFTAETVAAIDDFWVGAKELRKTDPRALFATRDGTTKSGSAYTLTVQRFCKRNGVTIGPKAIQVGVKRRLISEGHSSQKIAEMVGVQQGANLRERFASVEGANAPQRHADALEKKKREP
jgi:hypothetical protein